jgi:hypothetical protein
MPSMRLIVVQAPPCCESCLPKIEAWLEANDDFCRSLDDMVSDIDFRSHVDQVLWIFFEDLRQPMLDYYDGEGLQLRDLLTSVTIDKMDAFLCSAVPAFAGTVAA